ncbi:helix-turn-helix domain-containing protein [Jeotgalibaca caeni]|uniref:helix-turn-helix domain-containing protein n=1 Tax=Jeotgalibaca caeni TaxID=3028623 RepID=UPI00237E8D3E|nr:helix-turn-helix transcriptional regulator [Jeotgalibaca caeni]MDE1549558.1 helix-turn-helix transcriptional regulator [Jeotgalibaca caeni]
MVSIGERIKEARKKSGFTQQMLAEQLNVSRSAVSNWEVGRNYPDLDLIVQLSNVLELTLDELLREDTVMVKKVSKEQRKGVTRKRALRILVPILVSLLLTVGYFLYQDVGVIHDFFTPSVQEVVLVEVGDEWTTVSFEETPSFHMDKRRWKKAIVNHADNPSSLEIRITNQETNEQMEPFVLAPGKQYSLKKLDKQANYIAEVKGAAGRYFLTLF